MMFVGIFYSKLLVENVIYMVSVLNKSKKEGKDQESIQAVLPNAFTN